MILYKYLHNPVMKSESQPVFDGLLEKEQWGNPSTSSFPGYSRVWGHGVQKCKDPIQHTLNTDILDFWEGSGYTFFISLTVLTGKFPSSNMTVVCSNISVGRNLCIF